MHAEIGRAPLVVALLPRRRVRAHMFTASGRGLLAAGIAAAALLLGIGALTDRANSAPQPTPYSYIPS
ncbi:MAG: hypothetical protein ACXU82_20795 [Caulobacteraceae bacterium]